MKPQDKLTLISTLGTMLRAGIPVLEAVQSLQPDSKGAVRKFLMILEQSLNEGKPISDAMSRMPKAFDPVTINVMRAAENAGTLDETLQDLEINLKKDMAFRDQLRASLAYPLFIFAIFMGVLLLILGFVVPRISKVFTELRVPLPPVTQLMIQVSNFLLANYIAIALGAVVIIALIIVLFRWKRRALVNLLLKLPFLKNLGRETDFARFTRSFGLLLKAGVPIGEALKLSQAVVNKKEVRQLIDNMAQGIEQGKSLSECLQKSKHIVPVLMIRLIDTAERSGSLESSMQNLAEHFQTRVSQRLKTITTLIEPVMIVVVGGLVGGMMISIIAPIYNLIGQVRAR